MASHTEEEEDPVFSYSQFACIGTGFSGIALGATLQRWYGITDIRFFDKQTKLGGAWHVNQYPGCACDVPSALYSLSFECNPNWTRVLPTYTELWEYLNRVAHKYDLVDRMTFDVAVEKCVWIEERGRWRMWIRQKHTGQVIVHECQFLYSGVGHFDQPRELEIPGAERFEGPMFHSARWRHDVDLTDKKVVVFGNGCTGAQIVPAIVDKTAHLTQVVRSKHWVYPPLDEKVPFWLMFTLANIPGTMQIQRTLTFVKAEVEYIGFGDGKIAKAWRKKRQRQVEAYMRATAPAKYHSLLIPDFEVGCKRRIFDSGYLKSLHNEHLRLTDEPVEEILPNGLRMKSGEIVEADVIVLANGFKTNQFFLDCEIVGRGGQTIHEHWESFGGAEAYNCESLSGFPNFFLLGGPNTTTGHTSFLMAVENAVNYSLRVIEPVLKGKGSVVEVKREAEEKYVQWVHSSLQNTVFSTGCTSWYNRAVDGKKPWNATVYPLSQAHYWYSCVFPSWKDWRFSGRTGKNKIVKQSHTVRRLFTLTAFTLGLVFWSKRNPNSVLASLLAKPSTTLPWLAGAVIQSGTEAFAMIKTAWR
ncbi:unnamed protein product [Sordaria macrospora k-hell]|uniref:WGS project CABT00000000 data, contig 2.35 n=1 Tax=Sordaria macrospora (strain ATCC MYA-333 / DSM 997 / K(L3346) / K-hell) TaxID=771870 RepID=F7W6K0_SORMK|nr:uncharacterized protein SMAC_06357 [Sordaria macrospora k-hell]CCC13139.1 unnamed protein product [Sordaria macrospora k-hell]